MGIVWRIQIAGDKRDLRKLLCLNDRHRALVTECDGEFFIESDRLDATADFRRREEVGRELVEQVNGLFKLFVKGWNSVTYTRLVEEHADGTRTAYIAGTCRIRGSAGKDVAQSDLALAARDSAVAGVLCLMGQEWSWRSLYVVFEIIEKDMRGTQPIVDAGWATKSQVRLFKRTANNPRAIGDKARHGSTKQDPPRNPMSDEDAVQLIVTIGRRWIEAKRSPKQ